MTKNEIVDLIWDCANEDGWDIDKERGLIIVTKKQKEEFFQSLVDNDWDSKDIQAIRNQFNNFYYCKEEYFEEYRDYEDFKGGIDTELIDEYFQYVEYEIREVA